MATAAALEEAELHRALLETAAQEVSPSALLELFLELLQTATVVLPPLPLALSQVQQEFFTARLLAQAPSRLQNQVEELGCH